MLDRNIVEVIGKQDLLRMDVGDSVAAAARKMTDYHVGAMLVCEDGETCGIFTERDMLERVVAEGLPSDDTPLRDVMTPHPAAVAAGETVLDAIFAMREHRSRHLLVRDGEQIVGIVSVRDVLRSVVEDRMAEEQRLVDLWQGFPV